MLNALKIGSDPEKVNEGEVASFFYLLSRLQCLPSVFVCCLVH